MKEKKYNLKWYHWIFQVPVLYVLWSCADENLRKESFHLVLKSLEPHEHKFTIPVEFEKYKEFEIWKCDHEGCNLHKYRIKPINDEHFQVG